MTLYEATVITDTLSAETGDRCITIEMEYPRFVHAELMTHRVFSRNSASSRAVPVNTFLGRLQDEPVFPLVWASEKKGMQGGPPLEGDELAKAKKFWASMVERTVVDVEMYLDATRDDDARLHKSLINRWLEPALSHKVIVTGTDWGGFFKQRSTRYTDLAMPEIAKAADNVLAAIEASEPTTEIEGGLHLPYIGEPEWQWAEYNGGRPALIKVSVARCARVSYLTHRGIRDPEDDLRLYRALVGASPMHASPLEHVAYVTAANRHRPKLTAYLGTGEPTVIARDLPIIGNLRGFLQQRAIVEAERGI